MNIDRINKAIQAYTITQVFRSMPEQQNELAYRLGTLFEEELRHLDGFLSVQILKSHNGNEVLCYQQWTDKTCFDQVASNATLKSLIDTPKKKVSFTLQSYDVIYAAESS